MSSFLLKSFPPPATSWSRLWPPLAGSIGRCCFAFTSPTRVLTPLKPAKTRKQNDITYLPQELMLINVVVA